MKLFEHLERPMTHKKKVAGYIYAGEIGLFSSAFTAYSSADIGFHLAGQPLPYHVFDAVQIGQSQGEGFTAYIAPAILGLFGLTHLTLDAIMARKIYKAPLKNPVT